jgi:hypothetical protein
MRQLLAVHLEQQRHHFLNVAIDLIASCLGSHSIYVELLARRFTKRREREEEGGRGGNEGACLHAVGSLERSGTDNVELSKKRGT